MGIKEEQEKIFPEVGDRKVMWAVSAVFLLISVIFCYFGYHTPDPNIASIDDIEEWDGVLPDYEELEGELEGEKGTWIKSDFYLNEGMLGTFDCVPSGFDLFQEAGDDFEFVAHSDGPFNVSIVWDDSNSDGLLALEGWIDLHSDSEIQGATNKFCYRNGFTTGTSFTELTPWTGDGYNISVTETPIPLRGLFLIIDGEEGEEWYLASIGHDKNGGFDVEPFVSGSGLSKYLWGLGFAIPGLAILYWSFDPRNK